MIKARAFADDSIDVVKTGDMFYWPPGHTVRADYDTELVLFTH
jgi:hypothetical protein